MPFQVCLKTWSPCPSLPSAKITGTYYHPQLTFCFVCPSQFFPYHLIFSITVTLMMSEYYAEGITKVIFSNILLFRLLPTSLQWTVSLRNICKHLVLFTWNKLLWAELFCQCAYKNVRLWGHNTKLPARM